MSTELTCTGVFQGSFICNSQKLKTTQMPTSQDIDKHNVEYMFEIIYVHIFILIYIYIYE